MKQRKLVEKLYAACLEHNKEAQRRLAQEEISKVLKRKVNGKSVHGSKWTVVRG
jgi:hypothetical protein